MREEVKTFQGKPIMVSTFFLVCKLQCLILVFRKARIKAKPVIQSFVNFKNGIRPSIPGHNNLQSHLRLPIINTENFNPSVQNSNSPSPRVSYPNVPSVNYPQVRKSCFLINLN